MAIKEGSAVLIMSKYELGGCIAKYLGEENGVAFVDVPVCFAYGETAYDCEIPREALLELPGVSLDW